MDGSSPNGGHPGDADVSRHVLPTSATMVGACMMVISFVQLMERQGRANTIIDDLMAIDSIVFLISGILSYLSLRSVRYRAVLERRADLVFLGGMLLMVVAGCLLAWEIGVVPVTAS